ncbi:hypothetical protein [Actomonas aquatica]|uniref:Phasin domain-containing protein n=1 Tax=Actomonas aquatica TaxID=2866162 RepID=A0ABZ1C6T9_9BACT|nr:hypothetical protein [Opitutus sp. WL0086]WRQ87122.1 hypothetical protein K1X11_020105 [Opitutus sp. WL0086]
MSLSPPFLDQTLSELPVWRSAVALDIACADLVTASASASAFSTRTAQRLQHSASSIPHLLAEGIVSPSHSHLVECLLGARHHAQIVTRLVNAIEHGDSGGKLPESLLLYTKSLASSCARQLRTWATSLDRPGPTAATTSAATVATAPESTWNQAFARLITQQAASERRR